MPFLKIAKTKPSYSNLRVDDAGNTWICECSDRLVLYKKMRNAPDGGLWTVFDSTGVMLGTVNIPVGLLVQRLGAEEVGGVWRDQDDVPSVRIFRIRRPGR